MQIRCSAPGKIETGIDFFLGIDTGQCFLDDNTSENIEEKNQMTI